MAVVTGRVRICILLCSYVCLLVAGAAAGCSVPVFRYALERWENDPFQLVVFSQGKLEPSLAADLDGMEAVMDRTGALPNWKVVRVDVSQPVPALWAAIWEKQKSLPLPSLALCTPEWTREDPALHSAQLTKAELAALVSSPKRLEVLAQLLKGTAVVWLVAETADAKANSELLTLLETETKRLADTILISAGVRKDGVNVLSDLPLEVSFSLVRVRADDPAEALLMKLLNNGDPVTQPTLYPVFGRGRVLAALTAAKMNKELLEETARFLCGACSCQVKAQNPGFDLLLQADWQQIFGDNALPPPEKLNTPTEPKYIPIPGKK